VTVYHRTSDGTFEGPACASCGVATLTVDLCDEHLHILCAACGRSGKLDAARCRACRGESPQPPVLAIEDATAQLRIGSALP
jgi:transcription elongation factor Elf1